LRIVWREKSKVGKRVLKKSTIILAFIGLFGAMLMHQAKEIHQLV